MIIIQNVVGNENEAGWRQRLEGASVDVLALDQWEAQKSRLRKTTVGEVEIALSLDRNAHLHDGDILVWNEIERSAIVARIALNDVMIVDVGGVKGESLEIMVRTIFELGHALGNQHWPAIVKNDRVFVPLTIDRKVMMSVMKTHAFTHITYEFVPGVEVIPYMTPHEARRLFGGAGSASHAHSPVGAHDGHHHPHGHGH
jgi:urease accessory protein